MTTTVKIHVNGRYRATVTQKDAHGVRAHVVEGNYEGSSNPSGEHAFHLPHPAAATFDVIEEYVSPDSDAA